MRLIHIPEGDEKLYEAYLLKKDKQPGVRGLFKMLIDPVSKRPDPRQ
jgi:hypothetical protein